jgi:hypothetical protein
MNAANPTILVFEHYLSGEKARPPQLDFILIVFASCRASDAVRALEGFVKGE